MTVAGTRVDDDDIIEGEVPVAGIEGCIAGAGNSDVETGEVVKRVEVDGGIDVDGGAEADGAGRLEVEAEVDGGADVAIEEGLEIFFGVNKALTNLRVIFGVLGISILTGFGGIGLTGVGLV